MRNVGRPHAKVVWSCRPTTEGPKKATLDRAANEMDLCLTGAGGRRTMTSAMAALISVEEAQQIILSSVRPGPTVTLPLREAGGRTLAEPVVCDIDYPPFDRAIMDGYAVCAADLKPAQTTLRVIGQVAAGEVPDRPLGAGQAMVTNTGAPIPHGSDAVVPVEDTRTDGDRVMIRAAAAPGQYIARRGEYRRAGSTVLDGGTRLSAGQLAIAASAGLASVSVYHEPTVAVLVTGDELVECDVVPSGGQIRDSNRYLLDGLIRQSSCRPVDLGVVRDDPEALAAKIREGLAAGFLCISGGVSMGQFDFVPRCVAECGAETRFHKLALKPGKPTLFATAAGGSCVFGLPGNPVSVFVTYWLLVGPALAARQGRAGAVPRSVSARLSGPVGPTAERRTYRPARAQPDDNGQLVAEPLRWHGSGDPFGLARANALLVTEAGSPARHPGDTVEVILLEVP
jgi:molybdenum cofactor synthesis domain-containing protein